MTKSELRNFKRMTCHVEHSIKREYEKTLACGVEITEGLRQDMYMLKEAKRIIQRNEDMKSV